MSTVFFGFAAQWSDVLIRYRKDGRQERTILAHAIETTWTSPDDKPTPEQMAEAKLRLVDLARRSLTNDIPDDERGWKNHGYGRQEPFDVLKIPNIENPGKFIWEGRCPWFYDEDKDDAS